MGQRMAVPEDLLAIMQCLDCEGSLADDGDSLRCTACDLRYPVRDGIPIMLEEAAYRPEAS